MDEQKRTEIHLDGETNHDHHDGIFNRKLRSGYDYDPVTGERGERPTVTLARYESPTKATSLSELVDELGTELETYEPSFGTYAHATEGELKDLAADLESIYADLDQLDVATRTRLECLLLRMYRTGCWAERMRVETYAPIAKRGERDLEAKTRGGQNTRVIDPGDYDTIRAAVAKLENAGLSHTGATDRVAREYKVDVSGKTIRRICDPK